MESGPGHHVSDGDLEVEKELGNCPLARRKSRRKAGFSQGGLQTLNWPSSGRQRHLRIKL